MLLGAILFRRKETSWLRANVTIHFDLLRPSREMSRRKELRGNHHLDAIHNALQKKTVSGKPATIGRALNPFFALLLEALR